MTLGKLATVYVGGLDYMVDLSRAPETWGLSAVDMVRMALQSRDGSYREAAETCAYIYAFLAAHVAHQQGV